MPARSRKRRQRALAEAPATFARIFLATALLSTLQDRRQPGKAPLNGRKILRHALQGGAALSAASVAVEALRQRALALALTATAAGAATIWAAETLLSSPSSPKEAPRGTQE